MKPALFIIGGLLALYTGASLALGNFQIAILAGLAGFLCFIVAGDVKL